METAQAHLGQFIREYPPPYGPPLARPDQAQGVVARQHPRAILPRPENHGSFNLYYSHPPEEPLIGWKLGRGLDGAGRMAPVHRGVDLLACDPEEDSSMAFQPVEFSLRIHPLSGLLVLERGSPYADVAYFCDGHWVAVVTTMTLHQRVNKIRVATNVEYEIVYDDSRDVQAFNLREVHRERFFREHLNVTPPDIGMWPLPPPPHSSLLYVDGVTDVLGFETLSTAPGLTYIKGVETVTGLPVLVKEISIGGLMHVRDLVDNEIEVCKEVRVR